MQIRFYLFPLLYNLDMKSTLVKCEAREVILLLRIQLQPREGKVSLALMSSEIIEKTPIEEVECHWGVFIDCDTNLKWIKNSH